MELALGLLAVYLLSGLILMLPIRDIGYPWWFGLFLWPVFMGFVVVDAARRR